MRRITFSLVLLAVLVSTGVVMIAQDEAWSGTWKLNLAKSKYGPASLPPKSATTKQEATPAGVRLTTDGVDAKGKPTHQEITYKLDGKEYAVNGAPDANTTRMYTRIDSRTYQSVTKVNGKVTTTSKVVVAADGKTRTVTTTGKNAQGQTVNNVVFYDKQ